MVLCDFLLLAMSECEENRTLVQVLLPFIGCLEIQPNVIRCFEYALSRDHSEPPRKRRRTNSLHHDGRSMMDNLLSTIETLELDFQQGTSNILKSIVSVDTILQICFRYSGSESILTKIDSWMKVILGWKLQEQVGMF